MANSNIKSDPKSVKLEDIGSSLVSPATEETLQSIDGKYAKKITSSGNDTYIAWAVIGSSQASAVWAVKKISVSGSDTIFTWADGNSNFDNVATDLTALSYS